MPHDDFSSPTHRFRASTGIFLTDKWYLHNPTVEPEALCTAVAFILRPLVQRGMLIVINVYGH